MKTTSLKIVISLLVVVHLLGNLWHGDAHTILEVALPALKNVFVLAVIIAAPLLGTILLWTRFAVLGCWIIALSMVGSVTFSVYHHFVWISNDNVEHLPAGSPEDHAHFANSAEFIALAALVAALIAFYAAGRLQKAR